MVRPRQRSRTPESSRPNKGTPQRKIHTSARKIQQAKHAKRTPITISKRKIMNVFDAQTKDEIASYAKEGSPVFTSNAPSAAFVYLNRPKQLNALNIDMIRTLTPIFRKHETNPNTVAITLSGHGDRAFCAGGDIMQLYTMGSRWMNGREEKGYDYLRTFFREEYQLNYMISKLVTPFIAFMNGITMGGGVGLGMHGTHRIATEKTLFAMPETAIGFFPDVGAGHILPRIEQPSVGMYLALTGARIKGPDVAQTGLASQFIFSYDYPHLYNQLADDHQSVWRARDALNQCAVSFDDLPQLSLHPHLDTIERCFGKGSVSEIIEALKQEQKDVEFAKRTIKQLESMAPLSLRVTHEQMTRGKYMDLDEVLTMEYRIALNMIDNPDFYTGVKSVLIDKVRDRRPNWRHDDVKQVKDTDVYRFFDLPTGEKDLEVRYQEPAKGTGWESIRRRAFDGDNLKRAGPSDYQYPMFHPTPQQLFPAEFTTSAIFGTSRDLFHLMYWNYLLKHTWTRFPLTKDPFDAEHAVMEEYIKRRHEEEPEFAHDVTFDDILRQTTSAPDHGTSGMSTPFGEDLYNITMKIMKAHKQYTDAKRHLTVSQHPEERKQLEAYVEAAKPKGNEAVLFDAIDDKIRELELDQPMAAFVINKISEGVGAVPLLYENLGLVRERKSRETFFAEEILSNYAPEKVIEIRKQIKVYYERLAEILRLPKDAAPALMMTQLGTANVDLLKPFGEDWKTKIDQRNQDGTKYSNVLDLFTEAIDKMSYTEQQDLVSQFGLNLGPEALFPNDPQKQLAYKVYMDEASRARQESILNRNAFDPEVLKTRFNADGEYDRGLQAVNKDFKPLNYFRDDLPTEYRTKFEDDIKVTNVFSDGEIADKDDIFFMSLTERLKQRKALDREMGRIEEKLGTTLRFDPETGGAKSVSAKQVNIDGIQDMPINWTNIRLDSNASDDVNGVVVQPRFLPGKKDELTPAEVFDPEYDALINNPHTTHIQVVGKLKIANGVNVNQYQGDLAGLKALTIQEAKLTLGDKDVDYLKTLAKNPVNISTTATNRDHNSIMLDRLINEPLTFAFDGGFDENKIISYADELAYHQSVHTLSPKQRRQRQIELIDSALRFSPAQENGQGMRLIDNGEILPGEVIPESIQRFMRPYIACAHDLPHEEMFHRSATLAKITYALQPFVSEADRGKPISSFVSYDHLDKHPVYKDRKVEYTLAREQAAIDFAESLGKIRRAPYEKWDEETGLNSKYKKHTAMSPDPEVHIGHTQLSHASVVAETSVEERFARSFLRFIRVPDYAVEAIYPNFEYFLNDPTRHPGYLGQLNFDQHNIHDSPDSIKINFGDISRPMLPPKLAKTLNDQVAEYHRLEAEKGPFVF